MMMTNTTLNWRFFFLVSQRNSGSKLTNFTTTGSTKSLSSQKSIDKKMTTDLRLRERLWGMNPGEPGNFLLQTMFSTFLNKLFRSRTLSRQRQKQYHAKHHAIRQQTTATHEKPVVLQWCVPPHSLRPSPPIRLRTRGKVLELTPPVFIYLLKYIQF